MLSFFSKKQYLVDLLEGFVDIHNHILPGIDDGAENAENALLLLKEMEQLGFKKCIATPHIMHNYHENTPKTIHNAYEVLQNKINKENSLPRLAYAAEHMIDDNFEHILANGETLTLGENHLLIEMSYLQPSINFDNAVNEIIKKQLFPVLAHPERYLYFHKNLNIYKSFVGRGIQLQLNLLSLKGYYGKEIQKIANYRLEENLMSYLGTDTHHTRHLKALKETYLSRKQKDLLFPLIDHTISTFY